MLIVNLFAGPGAGKSTIAAYVFARLKMAGVNCELAPEFAKDKVWEHNQTALDNQIYVFAKQYYRITRCADQVDVVITDSPVALSVLYNRDPDLNKPLGDMIRIVNGRYDMLNYFVNRVKPYNPAGRLQTEQQAREMDVRVKDLMSGLDMPYRVSDGDLQSADKIVCDVLSYLEKKNGIVRN